MNTPLAEKLSRAAPSDEKAQRLAREFDAAATYLGGRNDPEAAKRLLGCWARARKYYCDLTGEPLV